MEGYFGDYDAEQVAEQCFVGLLLHDYGADIISAFNQLVYMLIALSVKSDKLGERLGERERRVDMGQALAWPFAYCARSSRCEAT
jgi:hypothetical protein